MVGLDRVRSSVGCWSNHLKKNDPNSSYNLYVLGHKHGDKRRCPENMVQQHIETHQHKCKNTHQDQPTLHRTGRDSRVLAPPNTKAPLKAEKSNRQQGLKKSGVAGLSFCKNESMRCFFFTKGGVTSLELHKDFWRQIIWHSCGKKVCHSK